MKNNKGQTNKQKGQNDIAGTSKNIAKPIVRELVIKMNVS